MFGVWQIPLTGRQTPEGWKKPGGRAAKPFPSPLIFKAMCTLMRNLIHVFLIHLHVRGRCSETFRPKGLGSFFHPHAREMPGFLFWGEPDVSISVPPRAGLQRGLKF